MALPPHAAAAGHRTCSAPASSPALSHPALARLEANCREPTGRAQPTAAFPYPRFIVSACLYFIVCLLLFRKRGAPVGPGTAPQMAQCCPRASPLRLLRPL